MKAKDLITGRHLHEGAEDEARRGPQPPPGSTSGQMPPAGGTHDPLDPRRMRRGGPPGRLPGPPRLFAGPEESALKDIMLLFLTEVAGNSYDGAIVRKLVEGKDLDRGELQHILDEGARIERLPESHAKVLEKIHQLIQILT